MMLCCVAMVAGAAERVKGDGKLTSKKITIEDFNAVKVDGVIDFTYVQSEAPSTVEITIDQNLHPYIDINVKDRVLNIGFKGAKVDHYTKFTIKANSKWLKEAKVSGNANFVVASELGGDETKIRTNDNSLVQFKKPVAVGLLDISVSGSANVVVEELKADRLECGVNGSGSVTLKRGSAKTGEYNILSNGDIHAFGIAVPELTCKVTGNGTAEVHPTDNMKASMIGNGKILYKGPTAVQQRIIGKGTIEEVK